MREDNTAQFNENDCQNNPDLGNQKSGCQMLGFLPPGGLLVMSQGAVKGAGRNGIVAMPIAELFVQHKSRKDA